MSKKVLNTVPQIIGISRINSEGKVRIIKNILLYLEAVGSKSLFLDASKEVILSTKSGSEQDLIDGKYLILPKFVLDLFEIKDKTEICFLQRPNGVAIKKFSIKVSTSNSQPIIYDYETEYSVIRQVQAIANPESFKDKLIEKAKSIKLRYNIKDYWKRKTTFEGWKVRKLLQMQNKQDDDLKLELIQQRLAEQQVDGSWNSSLIYTAKILEELSELGMTSNYPQIQIAIKWIFDQPESPYNPGMFFLKDELVKEQLKIVQERAQQESGPRSRFRKRPKSELNLYQEIDGLYYNICGPRIMWANALVLHSLLKFGYEYHERINTIFETLAYGGWCECNYQHGKSGWKKSKKQMNIRAIRKFEERTIFEFIHGGIPSLKALKRKGSRTYLLRLEEKKKDNGTIYPLWLPSHTQGCELITTFALSEVKNERMWRLAEAHLWRFARTLANAFENYVGMSELQRNSLTPYLFLRVFAKHKSTPATIGILQTIPWLVKNQNEDGTWGTEEYKESATIAVLEALKRVKFI